MLPLPHVSKGIVSEIESAIETLFGSAPEREEISITDVTIEDLGVHFAKNIQHTKLTASVTHKETRSVLEPSEEAESPEPAKESATIPEEEPAHEPLHSAPSELVQWDVNPAWGISIPSLNIRAPVLLPSMKHWTSRAWDLLEQQMQVGLNHGTVAYPHSAGPGRKGNLIIAGHSSPPTDEAAASSFGHVFAKLPNIDIGEEISVTTASSPITYAVKEKFVVTPDMTSILEQQYDESILKLITCYPVGTTKNRMIILAKKVE